MKKKLLPITIAAIMAAPFGLAQAAEVQVYGKVNVSAQSSDYEYGGTDAKDNEEIWSNASRLGVKGDINISETLKAVYKLEYEIFVDDGQSANNSGSDEFNQRNIYGGLSSTIWGQVVMGRHDTPTKLIQGEVDLFNDLENGDMKNYLVGETRASNMVMYSTPSMNGLTWSLQAIAGEEDGIESSVNDEEDDSLADHLSTAVEYKSETFSAGLAYDNDVRNADIWRGVASAKFGMVTLGALVQKAEAHSDDNNEDGVDEGLTDGMTLDTSALSLTTGNAPVDYDTAGEEQTGYVLSAKFDVTEQIGLMAQYGDSNTEAFDGFEADARQIAVGAEYRFNKKVKVFAYHSDIEVELEDVSGFDGDFKSTGIGMDIKF